jgi:hypothetical protein
MEKGFVILTESELENICGEFFDKVYYSSLYQTDTTDRSVEIFSKWKDELLKKVIERSKQNKKLNITVENMCSF